MRLLLPLVLLSVSACATLRPATPPASAPATSTSAPAAPRPGEHAVTSSDGGFSVRFPLAAKEGVRQQPTALGDVTMHTFLAADEGARTAFLVAWADFPEERVEDVDRTQLLEEAARGAAEDLKARVLESSTTRLQDFPAFALRARSEQLELSGRWVLVGARLYQLTVVHPPQAPPPSERAFFDSFALDPRKASELAGEESPESRDE